MFSAWIKLRHDVTTGSPEIMSETETGQQSGAESSEAESAPQGKAIVLDQTLWHRLAVPGDQEKYLDAWLTLLCRMVEQASRAVVVIGPPNTGPFKPVTYWPQRFDEPAINAATEMALAKRRGIAKGAKSTAGAGTANKTCQVAYPIIVDDALHGAVAMEVVGASGSALRMVMRQLQWGTAWVRLMLAQDSGREKRSALERVSAVIDMIGSIIEIEEFRGACNAITTDLALRTETERVSIGFVRRGHSAVVAISHSAHFGKRMNLMRLLGQAMDEAIDQRDTLLYPPVGETALSYIKHEELGRAHGARYLLTVPMVLSDRFIGAFTFERTSDNPFDQETIDLADAVAAAVGPILYEKRQNDRWLIVKALDSLGIQTNRLVGPGHVGRKLAFAALLAISVFLSFARGEYRVTADASISGLLQRAISAPFDGFIARAPVSAGDRVQKGQLLVALDDNEMVLERLRWVTTRAQKRLEYERAIASGKRADMNIFRAQIRQAEARIKLIDAQLARSRMHAPFDALIVSGDLTQKIGAAVRRGDVLFELTPLAKYRVVLMVDESEYAQVKPGQEGKIVFTALPNRSFGFEVTKVTPVAQSEGGKNTFRVEGRLKNPTPRLRPGMQGAGKIEIEERLLIWIWTRKFVDWILLASWRWLP